MKPIREGDMIPDFSLPDQHGKTLDISTIRGKKKFVIFFYPEDGTPGCTREACYFRDQMDSFEELDSMVIGISGQSVESHRNFSEMYNLNYPLLSDKDDRVRKLFGVPTVGAGLLPGRVTYIADREGKVIHIYNSFIKAERHVDEALRVCMLLKKIDIDNSVQTLS